MFLAYNTSSFYFYPSSFLHQEGPHVLVHDNLSPQVYSFHVKVPLDTFWAQRYETSMSPFLRRQIHGWDPAPRLGAVHADHSRLPGSWHKVWNLGCQLQASIFFWPHVALTSFSPKEKPEGGLPKTTLYRSFFWRWKYYLSELAYVAGDHQKCGHCDCRAELLVLFILMWLITSKQPMWLAAPPVDGTALKHGVQDTVSSSPDSTDDKVHEKEEKKKRVLKTN